jgi:hypothetical protein
MARARAPWLSFWSGALRNRLLACFGGWIAGQRRANRAARTKNWQVAQSLSSFRLPMISFRPVAFVAALLVGLIGVTLAHALPAAAAVGHLAPVDAKTNAAWLTQARASYPLDTCSVSGDKFEGGPMGQPKDYVYSQPGKPDRLIRFCCNDCVKDFKKDPAKYLEKIDAAAKMAKP